MIRVATESCCYIGNKSTDWSARSEMVTSPWCRCLCISPKGKVKVELALARGKRAYDKRQDMARRDAQREVVRELGRRAKGMN